SELDHVLELPPYSANLGAERRRPVRLPVHPRWEAHVDLLNSPAGGASAEQHIQIEREVVRRVRQRLEELAREDLRLRIDLVQRRPQDRRRRGLESSREEPLASSPAVALPFYEEAGASVAYELPASERVFRIALLVGVAVRHDAGSRRAQAGGEAEAVALV